MNNKLSFCVAGVPNSSKQNSSLAGLTRIKELGLDGMELEFVRGVNMKRELAVEVGALAKELGLLLSAHAPFFINLNARDEDKLFKSKERILKTAEIAQAAGAKTFTFHAGYYLKQNPAVVYAKIKLAISDLLDALKEKGLNILMSPETTGKPSSFGSFGELFDLNCDLSDLNLCIDFSHLFARSIGEWNTKRQFAAIFDRIKKEKPKLLNHLHMHLSGIQYSNKGEVRHLPLNESEFNYKELLEVLKEYEVKGILVCESPLLEEDALILKEHYSALPVLVS